MWGLVTAKGSSAAIGLVLLLAVVVLGFRRVKHDKDTNYPYRPGIEIRLPDGRITTRGYAGRHPRDSATGPRGRRTSGGEKYHLGDWEEWRRSYDERYTRT